jgi:hypothetical protein
MKKIIVMMMALFGVFIVSGCDGPTEAEENFINCIDNCEDDALEASLDVFVAELEGKYDVEIDLEGFEWDLVITKTEEKTNILLHYSRSDLTYEDGLNMVDTLFSIHSMIEDGLRDLKTEELFNLTTRIYIMDGSKLQHFTFEDLDLTSERRVKISLDQTDVDYETFLTKAFFEYKDLLDYRIHDYEVYMEVDTELGEVEVTLPVDTTDITLQYLNSGASELYNDRLNEITILLQDPLNEDYQVIVE